MNWDFTDWTAKAACADLAELFFPNVVWEPRLQIDAETGEESGPCTLCHGGENNEPENRCNICYPPTGELIEGPLCGSCHTGDEVERAGELAAKKVCCMCPVIERCLKDVQDAPLPSGQPDGVFGGLNRWERIWLSRVPVESYKVLHELNKRLGHRGCLELRKTFEEEGPPADEMKGCIPAEVSAKHGVPVSIAREWMQKAGIQGRRRERNVWTQVLFDALAKGEWLPRTEVLKEVAAAVPEYRAIEKAEYNKTSVERARSRFAQDAIRERKRYNQIEERVDENGNREIRMKLSVIEKG